MRKRKDIYISELRCVECGAVFPIPRRNGKRREQGHIKDLWCFRCKKITKFKENEMTILGGLKSKIIFLDDLDRKVECEISKEIKAEWEKHKKEKENEQ